MYSSYPDFCERYSKVKEATSVKECLDLHIDLEQKGKFSTNIWKCLKAKEPKFVNVSGGHAHESITNDKKADKNETWCRKFGISSTKGC